jgi:hypothetical protein
MNEIKSLFAPLLLFCNISFAQDIKSANLLELKGYNQSIYYSAGHKTRAEEIATRCDRASNYFESLFKFKPKTKLFILAPGDWKEHATFPVYGMPHYPDSTRLVIAAEDNDFWRSFLPPLEKLPPALADKIKKAYANKEGQLSMMPFFDLLALHELGHCFHIQGGLKMQRKWMGELFVNIMLHTYIAENEPHLLPALETFPEMVVAAGKTEYRFTSLADFEKYYDDAGKGMTAKNYGWYQCNLHVGGKNIYNAGGATVLKKFWAELKNNQENMSDDEFVKMLKKTVHPSVADVYLKWNE